MTVSDIELWNIHEDFPLFVGAQPISNAVGRVNSKPLPDSLVYSLNGSQPIPVFFKTTENQAQRLEEIGDFNIDTISGKNIRPQNELALIATYSDKRQVKKLVNFSRANKFSDKYSLRKRLQDAQHPQQVGQVVDGCWTVAKDESGQRCLEVTTHYAGLDRIILLTEGSLGREYTIRVRLQVVKWVRDLHNVGIVFKWNPHHQGDGNTLPSPWSTGLAYYYSNCAGLRYRFGVNVHFNEQGEKVGAQNLKEAVLCLRRYLWNRLRRRIPLNMRFLPQIVPGKHYYFELGVKPKRYSLSVWIEGRKKPKPQLVVENPPDLLPGNVAGIIAHRCGVRVYEFEIEDNNP